MARRVSTNGIIKTGLLEVMAIVYSLPAPVGVRNIHETVLTKEYVPYTTIAAKLKLLASMGYLEVTKESKEHLYTPAYSQTHFINTLTKQIFDALGT